MEELVIMLWIFWLYGLIISFTFTKLGYWRFMGYFPWFITILFMLFNIIKGV